MRSTGRAIFRAALETLEQRRLLSGNSAWVYPGADGSLLYGPTAMGERISDFSLSGYKGGNVALPNVPVKATVNPVAGDDTSTIQAAINSVAAMSPDANGFRGAVLLNPGTYEIGTNLSITTSGVVLRGSGIGSTILHATGTGQRTIIQVNGSGTRSTVANTTHNITNKYVPSGAISFTVDSTANLAVGDQVIVHRPSTQAWIDTLGMDQLDFPWTPGSRDIDMERSITRIDGNAITIDAPITQALDSQYGGGTIYKFTATGRINNVGVENLSSYSDYNPAVTDPTDGPVDEDHPWVFINVDGSTNAWVRDVQSQYYGYSCVYVTGNSHWVTVQDSFCLDPVSQITGGRRYSFNEDDSTGVLFRNNYARNGRHDFVLGSGVVGPNVFVDGLAEQTHADIGPHHRYSTQALWDNLTGGEINVQNRGNLGSGHGWSGANEVVWNSTSSGGFTVQNPPTASNWLIGGVGPIENGTVYVGPHDPGYYDSTSTASTSHVAIRSLYYYQLQQRMRQPGAQYRELWLGDVDNYTRDAGTVDDVYVDPGWRATMAALGSGAPLEGFDQVQANRLIPFSFKYSLAPGEQVISASLSLGMKGISGQNLTDDIVYLDSPGNTFSFAQLGSTQPTTAAGARVLDLSSQLALLQDGRLNVAVKNDSAIDWAVLNIQTAPARGTGTTRNPEADTYVRDGTFSGQIFGSDPTLVVKGSSAGFNRESYLRFDLTGLSANAPQYKVRLMPLSASAAAENVMSLVTDDSWTEASTSWNTKPASTVSFASFLPQANVPVEVDVTPWVKEALAAGDTKLSLRLYSLDPYNNDSLVTYGSRDNGDTNSRPQLYAVTQAPTISSIANQGTAISTAKGPINFTVGDVETAAASLLVSAVSSNPTLLPNGNISFGGSGAGRTITLNPAAGLSGTADVTITVTDADGGTTTRTFTLSVNPTFSPASTTGTIRLLKNGSNVEIYVNSASPTYTADLTTISQLVITGGSGADSLIIDTTNGLPLPAGGVAFDGLGGADIIDITGTSSGENVTLAAGQVQLGSTLITYANTETMNLTLGSGNDVLSTSGVSPVSATSFNLNVQSNGLVQLGSATTLPTFSNVAIAAGGQLDLNAQSETIDQLTGTGSVEVTSATLSIGNAGSSFAYAGAVGGAGSAVKLGAGTVTFSGINAYTASTNVLKGTLKIASSTALPYTNVLLGNGTDAATLDLSGNSATIASLAAAGNNSSGNAITNLTAGHTLTVIGGSVGGNIVSVGGLTGADNVITKLTISGGGAMSVSNQAANIFIDNDAINSSSTHVCTLDVSGLASFSADVQDINIGVSPTNQPRARGILTLAASNTITANTMTLGRTTGNAIGGTQLNLGQSNTLNINSITLATGKGNSAAIAFRTGLSGPSVTINDKNTGVGADLIAGYKSNGGTASPVGTLDFSLGTINATLHNLILGWNNDASANTATGTFTMNGGNVTAASVTIGNLTAVGGSAIGTLTLNGGSFAVNGDIVDGGGTSTLNLNGASLNLNNHAIGDATNPINTLTLASGGLSNVTQINGGGAITKTGAGQLIFGGAMPYTGATNVNAGTLLLNTDLLNSSAINVNAGLFKVGPAQTRVVKTPAVTVAAGAKLDLTDNKLIVTTAGQTANVATLITSGRSGGTWTGSGIITSSASGNLTTLGVATAADAGKSTFAGVSVSTTDTLVLFTYSGDANLDGKINVDDYGHIDTSIPLGLSGWFNGDFNYDGKINVDDYGLIDFNIGIQGPPFPT